MSRFRLRRARRPVLPRWLTLLLVCALLWLGWNGGQFPPATIRTGEGERVEVIDGDSLRIGGRVIRLHGYDAPEYPQSCRTAEGRDWPCGRMARERLVQLVAPGGLACTDRGRDRYRRTLANCRTAAGEIGAIMVSEGLGLRLRHPRDGLYLREQEAARRERRGVWQGDHAHPADWRDARPEPS